MSDKVQLSLSIDQAQALRKALEIYARLCIGQFHMVAELVCDGTIPVRRNGDEPRAIAAPEQVRAIEAAMQEAKRAIEFEPYAGFSVGHPHVHVTGSRAWEIYKTLSRTLAVYLDPVPEFRGVDRDGLIVRYTNDPAPVATVILSEAT